MLRITTTHTPRGFNARSIHNPLYNGAGPATPADTPAAAPETPRKLSKTLFAVLRNTFDSSQKRVWKKPQGISGQPAAHSKRLRRIVRTASLPHPYLSLLPPLPHPYFLPTFPLPFHQPPPDFPSPSPPQKRWNPRNAPVPRIPSCLSFSYSLTSSAPPRFR